jgi:opacity protein-like surface antigen
MKRFFCATVGILIAAPAMAADLPSAALPPAPAVYDWTGFRAGAFAAWAWSRNDFSSYNTLNGAFVTSGADDASTFHGGLAIGYDFMTASRLVLGASASVALGTASSSTTSNAAGTNVSTSHSADQVGGNVLAKVGYAFGDYLPYLAGGWAWSTETTTRTQLVGTTGLATPGTAEQANIYRNGWTLGGGLSYRVWGNWEVFGQYLYTKYGAINVTYPAAQRRVDSSVSANLVSLGVDYKF